MPIYEYECPTHGRFEVTQRITEDALKKCPTPKCGKPVKKLISHTSFALKGTGWYATDYNGKSNMAPEKPAPAASESTSTSDSASESKTETKVETKAEAKTEAKPEKKAEKKAEKKKAAKPATGAAKS